MDISPYRRTQATPPHTGNAVVDTSSKYKTFAAQPAASACLHAARHHIYMQPIYARTEAHPMRGDQTPITLYKHVR